MNKSGSCTVGLYGQFVTIHSYGSEALRIVNFLCCDLQSGQAADSRVSYDFMAMGKTPTFSLWQGDRQEYFGTSRYDAAYTLINEIIYHCINENADGYALHAAALGSEQGGVLLPGQSGSGKSTLTAWLVSQGANYLTDELVLLTEKGRRIHAVTRPISLKSGSAAALAAFCKVDQADVISGTNGCMLPHRLLNRHSPAAPALALILFPQYSPEAVTRLQEVSPARACAGLLECFVNARNIAGHGISELAGMTRTVPAFRLQYSSFTGLYELLSRSFPFLFS